MRFGIWTPLPHTIRPEPRMQDAVAELTEPGSGDGLDGSYRFALDVVREAESAGFSSTLIAQRYLGPDLDAWMLASALAANTRTIEIMPAVHPGIVLPQLVAKFGATLDRISAGRAAVNIVNGWWADEFNMYGNGSWLDDPAARGRRMNEFISVLKGLWTEGPFTFEGEFFKVKDGRLPTTVRRQPHPPLYAASRSGPGKDTIARHCDVWFAAYKPGFRNFAENITGVGRDITEIKQRAHSYGRTLSIGLSTHMICCDSLSEAHAQADALEAYGATSRIALVPALALGAGLVGTPDLIVDRIEQYRTLGVDLLMLHFHPMVAGLRSFIDRVMPKLPRDTTLDPFASKIAS
jgi:FMNH2-dependent dimethyl sulfone monooxygenase